MHSLLASDLNILLVEPSAIQRKVISKQLKLEDITAIDEASNQQEALTRIRAVRPDLVISSLYFPDGSATELLKILRSDPAYEDLPFMLISSENRRDQLEIFKQSGVVAILPKPFNREHLGTAINSTLDLLSVDEVELDYYDIQNIRVLVVDDSRMARKAVMRVLANLGVTDMTQACDGSEAIELLQQKTFDLVVTDYNMPEVTGVELAEYIRNSPICSHLPVLMVTSEANDAHLSNVAKSGVNAMTDKPFEPETVKKLLMRLLNES